MNLWVVILMFGIIVFQAVFIVRLLRGSGHAMIGEGWYDIQVSAYVRMRFYKDKAYWEAHGDIPEQNILEKGTYKHDYLNWIRYSIMDMTGFKEANTKGWKECNCTDCRSYLKKQDLEDRLADRDY